MVANIQVVRVGPNRISTGDENGIVARERCAAVAEAVADDATVAIGFTAVGDGETVTGTVVTNHNIAGVAPDGTRAGDSHGVAAGHGLIANMAYNTEHCAAVGDRQRVAKTLITDEKLAITPNRTSTGDGDGVIAGDGVVTDVAGGAKHLGAIGDE